MLTKQQQLLIKHEGMVLKPYTDTVGKLTIGIGRNIEDRGISEDEALYMMNNDVRIFTNELIKALPWYTSLSDVRRAALMSMAFMGVPRLMGFKKMLAAMKIGHWSEAAKEALDSKWARDVGPNRSNEVANMIRSNEWQK